MKVNLVHGGGGGMRKLAWHFCGGTLLQGGILENASSITTQTHESKTSKHVLQIRMMQSSRMFHDDVMFY